MSALGPRADLLTQFSPTAATKGKADASWLGFSTLCIERRLSLIAVIQIGQDPLIWTATNSKERRLEIIHANAHSAGY